jgi:hypothetical protein
MAFCFWPQKLTNCNFFNVLFGQFILFPAALNRREAVWRVLIACLPIEPKVTGFNPHANKYFSLMI